MEQIPSPLAQLQKLLLLLRATHLPFPVLFPASVMTPVVLALVLVLAADGKGRAFGFVAVVGRGRTAVVALVFVAAAAAAVHGGGAGEDVGARHGLWVGGGLGGAGTGVRLLVGSAGRHWGWWCGWLHAAVVYDFGHELLSPAGEALHGLFC